MDFVLHPNLSKKIFLTDFPLCKVLLEDERHYPWFLLVPRKSNTKSLIDLTFDEQVQLMKELQIIQQILWQDYSPTQVNVAAIGNKTPQLHVHVIARFSHDPAWPGTVWDHPVRAPYFEEEKLAVVEKMKTKLVLEKNQ